MSLVEEIQAATRKNNITATKVGRVLNRLRLEKIDDVRPRGYVFPSLLAFRKAFDRMVGSAIEWDLGATEWEAEATVEEYDPTGRTYDYGEDAGKGL